MKKLIFLLSMSLPVFCQAQFVVGAGGITFKAGATVTIDSLVLQPTADVTLTSNQVQRSGSNATLTTGNTINRVYTFSTPVNFTGTIGFSYKDAEMAGNTESGLVLIYSAASSGNVWLSTTGSILNTTANYISKSFSGVSLGRISATSNGVPLDVTLLDFTAEKNEEKRIAILTWTVAKETNIDHYTVQRSTNGVDFTTVGVVPADAQPSYSLTDNEPENGMNYYRLQIAADNGDIKYSAVRQLYFGVRNTDVSIYPNPVIAEVAIHTDDVKLEGMEGMVTDAAGKLIARFRLSGNTTTIQATAWPPGIYIIRLSDGQAFKVQKQ